MMVCIEYESLNYIRLSDTAACDERTCALRAPTAFSVRIRSIRTETADIVTSKDSGGFHKRSPIAYGWVHHPCAIGDPRGRVFVRAKSVAGLRPIRTLHR